jgi:bacteriocin biosynthesis cyclodehydratase domain-containing protein
VVIADDYLDPRLKAINNSALLSGRPWLLVKLGETSTWIGPLFRPGITACWMCLSQRLHGNLKVRSHLRRSAVPYRSAPSARLPWSVAIAARLAAMEAAKAIVHEHGDQSDAQIVSIDLCSLKTDRHSVVRRPQCPCDRPGVAIEAGLFGRTAWHDVGRCNL